MYERVYTIMAKTVNRIGESEDSITYWTTKQMLYPLIKDYHCTVWVVRRSDVPISEEGCE